VTISVKVILVQV